LAGSARRIGRLGPEGDFGQIFRAIDAEIAASIRRGYSFDEAYRLIGKLGSTSSSQRVPEIGPEGIIAAVNGARTFLRLGRKLRDLAPEPALDDYDDADALQARTLKRS
jgi:hypothetical protein